MTLTFDGNENILPEEPTKGFTISPVAISVLWPVILAVVTMAVLWGKSTNTVDNSSIQLTNISIKLDSLSSQVNANSKDQGERIKGVEDNVKSLQEQFNQFQQQQNQSKSR